MGVWVFLVCVLCGQIQPRACAYASCWQINPVNLDLRCSQKKCILECTFTHSDLSLTHTHTCIGVCVVGCHSVCERDRQIAGKV